MRPAYSAVFAPEALKTLEAVRPIEDITPEWAWGGATGKGVKVAVIDSGVDHPDAGHVDGYMAISLHEDEQLVYSDEPHEDLFGHGNAVAAIIRSIAPQCEIYSVRVLGARLSTKGTVFAAGLRWVVENGMDICNLSLGTTRSDYFATLHELSDRAYFQNTLLVTAANNMPTPSYPSVFASVIAVAAHSEPDPFRFYYNPQPPVEFGAFGIDVRAAWKAGTHMTVTGNSFAAPHLAGIVTLIRSKHPELTPFQMKAVLRALCANVPHGPSNQAAPPTSA